MLSSLISAGCGSGGGQPTSPTGPTGPTVPQLITALRDADQAKRLDAIVALRNMGPAAKEAVPALAATLAGDEVAWVRLNALLALVKVGGDSPEVLAALDGALEDPSDSVVVAAGEAMLQSDPENDSALGALASVLQEGEPFDRASAASALRHAGPRAAAAAVPRLCDALKDPERSVRECAAQALGSLRSRPERAVPCLV